MSDTKNKIVKETLQVPQDACLPTESEDERPLENQRSSRSKRNNAAALQNAGSDLDLNILLKFIKPYDGNRETLNSFLINCNNAYDLASSSQKPIVFKYILCQLNGKAETACSIKEFQNWDQLKDFLKTQFSERKHFSHLLMELQETKQLPGENVNSFSLKIEKTLSQLLTEISLNNTKAKELPGRIAAMEDLALHHFSIGLHPRISNIIRCKSPKSLNEAINFATSEERIQETLYRGISRPHKSQKPQNSPMFPNQTFFKKVEPVTKPLFQRKLTSPQTITCNYCKNPGHSIENCIKRQYNRQRYSTMNAEGRRPQRNLPSNLPTGPSRGVYNVQDEGVDEIDDSRLNE